MSTEERRPLGPPVEDDFIRLIQSQQGVSNGLPHTTYRLPLDTLWMVQAYYTYIHWGGFRGQCRQICHTWSVWVLTEDFFGTRLGETRGISGAPCAFSSFIFLLFLLYPALWSMLPRLGLSLVASQKMGGKHVDLSESVQ